MARHDPRDLGAQVYRAIAGRSINTEPSTFSAALSWFMRKGGNPSAAARLAGVPRRTMRDWLEGKGLGPRSQARRDALVESARLSERRARLGPKKEARIRALGPRMGQSGGGITVTGSYNYDDSPESRAPIPMQQYMLPSAGDQLVDAYLNGAGPEQLRELFADLIDDAPFYHRTLRLPPDDRDGWQIDNVTI